MKLTKTYAAAALTALAFAIPTAYADDQANAYHFVTICDTDNDGAVSKAEVMKTIEKMFDKADTKKAGKLDKNQVEVFLQDVGVRQRRRLEAH